jgi:hypothetical protein
MLLFRPFGSEGSDAKLHSLLPSGDFWFMVKSEVQNIMKARLRTSNGGSSLCTFEVFDWCSEFRSSNRKVGTAA